MQGKEREKMVRNETKTKRSQMKEMTWNEKIRKQRHVIMIITDVPVVARDVSKEA